jgi:hypothetical protein
VGSHDRDHESRGQRQTSGHQRQPVRFLRSNADDVTAIVFGKSGEEHSVLVKGALVRVAEDLNMALRRRDIAPAPATTAVACSVPPDRLYIPHGARGEAWLTSREGSAAKGLNMASDDPRTSSAAGAPTSGPETPIAVPPAETPELKTLVGLVIGVVVVAALYLARDVLVPIMLAVLLSFLLTPLANLLRAGISGGSGRARRRRRRAGHHRRAWHGDGDAGGEPCHRRAALRHQHPGQGGEAQRLHRRAPAPGSRPPEEQIRGAVGPNAQAPAPQA